MGFCITKLVSFRCLTRIYNVCIVYDMIKTLNISLPKALIQEIDLLARRQASSRSELIRDSLRAYIVRAKMLEKVYRIGEKKAKTLRLKSETDVFKFLER